MGILGTVWLNKQDKQSLMKPTIEAEIKRLEAMPAVLRVKKKIERKKKTREEGKKWVEEKEITDWHSDHPNQIFMNDTAELDL